MQKSCTVVALLYMRHQGFPLRKDALRTPILLPLFCLLTFIAMLAISAKNVFKNKLPPKSARFQGPPDHRLCRLDARNWPGPLLHFHLPQKDFAMLPTTRWFANFILAIIFSFFSESSVILAQIVLDTTVQEKEE
jgi:hypothetical protein